ncbi:hypothetical protein Kpol_1054p38 [Vanderwaltozyma polyspora DSM 70294]|uniref:Uncharacterized protein n=1 Tax=Vanderwaltozyma polyspora (strain ATCC 22028 / DSM 70294 / BCRC 21397 / CBS 2163 / NBRC 10782 / NRRL Y-8283 / UCD 57-17) TaxID=436907 RepID=A7TIC5_VANPO|nr:uncharacterized protein Kpol_1054p38 [Vanderwaltozyma polyspora DSM 70294]EDO17991.1 hypothetical protein Kpol_1054p38 [Vanderwaltozyma polyspora DSM 70294]
MSVDIKNWPNPVQVVRTTRPNPTIEAIRSIFYNSGFTVSVIYLLLEFIFKPSLERQYEQRVDLNGICLLQVRHLVVSLQKRLKTTPVSIIGFNETEATIEKSTQTGEDKRIIRDYDDPWEGINDNLEQCSFKLDLFNNDCGRPSIIVENFTDQTKVLTDQLNDYNQTNNKPKISHDITQGIREMKGWFVNGVIS